MSELKSRLDLRFRARDLKRKDILSQSDGIVIVELQTGSHAFAEVGRTEVVQNNHNPEWLESVEIDYFFEELQTLRLSVYDVDAKDGSLKGADVIGQLQVTVGDVLAQPGCRFTGELKKGEKDGRGHLSVTARESSAPTTETFKFRCFKLDKKDFFGKSDPYLTVLRRDHGVLDSYAWSTLYKSDVIKNNLNPSFPEFSLRGATIGGAEAVIRIELWDWDSNSDPDLIGRVETSVLELQQCGQSKRQLELINPKKATHGTYKHGFKRGGKYKNSGTLEVEYARSVPEFSLVQYLQGGLEMNFVVAVDFTGSNGNPQLPTSLHYQNPYALNCYQEVLTSVGGIVQQYDLDKHFPSYGFGAKMADGSVQHCFALNGNWQAPYCQGVPGIIGAYRHALSTVQLWGPTNFSPVIEQTIAAVAAEDRSRLRYTVLLIVTDGAITDMPETLASIVRASHYPISIIIVGVGPADFGKMETLDGDGGVLSDTRGNRAARDIVQFVPFREFPAEHPDRLAAAVLAEVPSQVTGFFKSKGIAPPGST